MVFPNGPHRDPEVNPCLGIQEGFTLENVEGGTSKASLSPSTTPTQPYLLITCLNFSSSGQRMDTDESHLLIVERVVNVLADDPSLDHSLDNHSSPVHLDSDISDASLEPDNNMTLSHYQKDIKLKALARRGPSKSSSRSKKGKRNPLP